VVIDTPITSDALGNLYFGFLVLGATPTGLASGIARIAANGAAPGSRPRAAAGDVAMQKVVYNCAPALSRDGASLYLAVNDVAGTGFGFGYLLKLNAQTLVQQAAVRLKDVATPLNDAYLPDDGTASPTIGPDGDVYFGVLENPFFSNHVRGWMLHFDAALTQTKTPGAFGWDNTAAIVPAAAVPSYGGPSSYLLLTKYNNYAGTGGDGVNKVAVLRPEHEHDRPGHEHERDERGAGDRRADAGRGPDRDLPQRGARVVHQRRGGRSPAALGAGELRGRQALPLGLHPRTR
jgi:hypothetical protein